MKRKRKLFAHEVAVMLRVQEQLARLKQPNPVAQEIFEPTRADYERMDPYWMSTMTGAFAGRSLTRQDFPKMNRMFRWILADLRKWPWRKGVA